MKKQSLVMMMILTAALTFGQGIIKDMAGTVELKPAGAAAFVAAKVGDRIAQNTIISTGFKSIAIISVGSTTLSVRALTRLSLTEIQQAQGTEQVSVTLQAGQVRVAVRPPVGSRADVSVRSPSATASVRGTEFEFGANSVTVFEGTVTYAGNDGRVVLVNSGASSRVDPASGRAAAPVEIAVEALRPPSPAGTDQTSESRNDGTNGGNAEVQFTLGFKF